MLDGHIKSVDDYIVSQTDNAQTKLLQLRSIIKSLAPEAEEKLSYGMPYFSLNGRLAYYGAFKDHVSLYPMKSGVDAFKDELRKNKLKYSAGTVQFPLDKPLPIELITKIIKHRVEENLSK